VALQILRTGDWISLHGHEASLQFTKQPLTYWAMAASVQALGWNTWAVRLPMALAFVLSTFLVYRMGRVFVPQRPWLPAIVYLSAPLPLLAANYVSTDGTLAAMEALAVACWVHARFGGGNARWIDAMWLAFGLAFLTKGPPALLPLLAIVASRLVDFDGSPRLLRPLGLLAFAVVGFTWFGLVVQRHPGLLEYFLGHEVVARVATAEHDRSPQWYGWLVVYGPAFGIGLLPWLPLALWRHFRAGGGWPRWRELDAASRFLWLWLLLPLLVFCLSRSRMWLYVLPLFAPASLLVARGLGARAFTRPLAWVGLGAWLALLVAIKAGLGNPVGDGAVAQGLRRNSSANLAARLQPLLPGPPQEIVFVEDKTRYGLHLYLRAQVARVSFKSHPKAISDADFDMTLAQSLAAPRDARIYILKAGNERYFLAAVEEAGYVPRRLGALPDARGDHAQDRVVYTLADDFPVTR
jgi:4-amino-4-deoxy-L-arabinose transferase-like glycosyltransferase